MSFIYFSAKPTDFDFLKVIGKGSFGKVRVCLFSPSVNKYLRNACFILARPQSLLVCRAWS